MEEPGVAAVGEAAPQSQGETARPGADDRVAIPPPRNRPEDRAWWRRALSYTADIFRGVWRKGEQDNIFFLAGAISFNVLVAFIPLVIAVLGIAGTIFKGQRAQARLIGYLDQVIPAAVGESVDYRQIVDALAANSTGILSVGTLFLLWIATRLVGTLRTVLREIFDIAEGRNIISGKIFDIKMVFMAGTLFIVNVGLTIGLTAGAKVASSFTGISPEEIPFLGQARNWWPQILAFATIWVMFMLVYRYLPPRRIRWSTAMIAATFTSVVGEAMKLGFTKYIENFARFDDFWGPVATFVILVLWIYYTSVVFILGGEVAQVVAMQRIRRRQKERLV